MVAALLRVARLTAGLAESIGSLPPGLIMQTDCQEPGSARQSSMGYLYLLIADDGQMSEEHISVGANDRTHSDTHVVIN